MSTIFRGEVQQTAKDVELLKQRNTDLQIAVAAADYTVEEDENLSHNTVWKTITPGEFVPFQWSATYALNWTESPLRDTPEPIKLGTTWKSCAIGSSLIIEAGGKYVTTETDPLAKPNCLNVAANNKTDSVHVVIGIPKENKQGEWEPIWVATKPIATKGNGNYFPSSLVQLWYQGGDRAGTIIRDRDPKSHPNVQYVLAAVKMYFYFDVRPLRWRSPSKKPFRNPFGSLMASKPAIYDPLIPLISVRRGIYFKNLSYQPFIILGGEGGESEIENEDGDGVGVQEDEEVGV